MGKLWLKSIKHHTTDFFKLKNPNLKVKVTTSFGVHWSSGSRDIAHLICHMTSQNHIINGHVTGGQGQV